jgi:hypothetical protein
MGPGGETAALRVIGHILRRDVTNNIIGPKKKHGPQKADI